MLSQGNKVMTSEEIRKKWESIDRREKKAKYNQFYPHTIKVEDMLRNDGILINVRKKGEAGYSG